MGFPYWFAWAQNWESRNHVIRTLSFINITLCFALTCFNFLILERFLCYRWKILKESRNTGSLMNVLAPDNFDKTIHVSFLFFVSIFIFTVFLKKSSRKNTNYLVRGTECKFLLYYSQLCDFGQVARSSVKQMIFHVLKCRRWVLCLHDVVFTVSLRDKNTEVE